MYSQNAIVLKLRSVGYSHAFKGTTPIVINSEEYLMVN